MRRSSGLAATAPTVTVAGDPSAGSVWGAGEAVRRGQVVVLRLLLLMTVVESVSGVVAVTSQWHSYRYGVLALAAPGCEVAWLVRLGVDLRRSSRDTPAHRDRQGGEPRRLDAALLVLTVASGLAAYAVATGRYVVTSQANPGYGALVTAVCVAVVRWPVPASGGLAAVAALGHLWAARQAPTEALQGFGLLLLFWLGTWLLLGEIRRAATDADQAVAQARETERESGAHLVHDTLSLVYMAGHGSSPPTRGLVDTVNATRGQVRAWVRGEPPPATLRQAVRRATAAYRDLPLRHTADGGDLAVPAGVAQAVRRAVHTVLANVREHAHASRVTVRVEVVGEEWTITVADNGRGFDPANARRGMGLTTFAGSNLARFGVGLHLQSAPGEGTTVSFHGTVAAAAGVPVGRSRFASWRPMPTGGALRAAVVLDIAVGLLLLAYWELVVSTAPDVAHHDRAPVVALSLAVGAVAAWTALWLAGPDRGHPWYLVAALGGSAAGTVVTALAGDQAPRAANPAIFMAATSGAVLAAMNPGRRYLAAVLTWPQLPGIARHDLPSALVLPLWAGLLALTAGALSRALTDFGRQSDAAQLHVAALERLEPATLVERQLDTVLDLAVVSAPEPRSRQGVDAVIKDSQDYLYPPPSSDGLREALLARLTPLVQAAEDIDLDLDGLRARPQPDVVAIVTRVTGEVVGSLLPGAYERLDLKASGDDSGWTISLLDGGFPAGADPSLAVLTGAVHQELARAGVEVEMRSFPGGGRCVRLRGPRA